MIDTYISEDGSILTQKPQYVQGSCNLFMVNGKKQRVTRIAGDDTKKRIKQITSKKYEPILTTIFKFFISK